MSKLADKVLVRDHHTCPSWLCFSFDNHIRRLLHNPYDTIKPFIKEGFTVLDVGPGKGFFTLPIADLIGPRGKVIAADIQKEMLNGLKERATKSGVSSRIIFHLADYDALKLNTPVDFALAFWMLHEVKDKKRFLTEIKSILKENRLMLIAEPKIHVTEKMFNQSIQIMNDVGFKVIDTPKIFFSRSVLIQSSK